MKMYFNLVHVLFTKSNSKINIDDKSYVFYEIWSRKINSFHLLGTIFLDFGWPNSASRHIFQTTKGLFF